MYIHIIVITKFCAWKQIHFCQSLSKVSALSAFYARHKYRAVTKRQGPGIFRRQIWQWALATLIRNKRKIEPKELLIVQSPSYYCIYPVTWNFIDSPAHRQCCQLCRINRETPDFGPYLLVLRLESETSRIVCHFFKTGLSDNEISNNFCCLSYLTVNIECLLINSGMAL